MKDGHFFFRQNRKCWASHPGERPNFTQLEEMLGSQLEMCVRQHYVDLNDPYVQTNNQKLEKGKDYMNMMASADYTNFGPQQQPQQQHQQEYVNVPLLTVSCDPVVDESEDNAAGSNYLTMTASAAVAARTSDPLENPMHRSEPSDSFSNPIYDSVHVALVQPTEIIDLQCETAATKNGDIA